jgi:hypothetical protein
MIELRMGLSLSCGILLVTLFLGLWQRFEQRSRDPETNDDDREFFRRQDRRRYAGIAVMVALALSILVDPLLFSVLPASSALREKSVSGPISMAIWLIVCVVIVVLLVLAFLDLLATRQYALRHRQALEHERSKLVLELIHRSGSSDSGRGSSESNEKL